MLDLHGQSHMGTKWELHGSSMGKYGNNIGPVWEKLTHIYLPEKTNKKKTKTKNNNKQTKNKQKKPKNKQTNKKNKKTKKKTTTKKQKKQQQLLHILYK